MAVSEQKSMVLDPLSGFSDISIYFEFITGYPIYMVLSVSADSGNCTLEEMWVIELNSEWSKLTSELILEAF